MPDSWAAVRSARPICGKNETSFLAEAHDIEYCTI
jgi:hypothetical protein